ncbi:MAG: hypothetical protein ACRD1Z_12600, partial [Vicinamibacteria bacterium]
SKPSVPADKRVVDRLLKQGKLSKKEYEAYLKRLPDCVEKIADSGELQDTEAADADKDSSLPEEEQSG